jgi:hypothetical protein
MSKKRHRNAFVDEQAEEDSAEESDTEKKQRLAAIKKLKSNRPSKFSQLISVENFSSLYLVSDDDDDEEEDEIDEKVVAELNSFIAEPGEDVNKKFSINIHVVFLFLGRGR